MEGNTIRTLCPVCERETNCKIEKQYINKYSSSINDEFSIYVRENLAILICQGCNTGFFRKDTWHSEAYDETTTEIFPSVNILVYPPNKKIEKLSNSDADMFIYNLYQEISSAINTGLALLSAMGVRTLLDRLCIQLVGDQGGFFNNLKRILEKKHCNQSQFELFLRVLEIGNSSVHRGFTPSLDDVRLCLETIEFLIDNIYIIPKHLQKLKAVQTPPDTRAKNAP